MSISVEYHFDFGSPNAYLSHLVVPQIERRTGVSFTYVPVLLGGVFKATNNVSPMVAFAGIRNKTEYQALETRRFIAAHGITTFHMNPHFPLNTLQIMRGAVVASRGGFLARYVDAMFRHVWSEQKKMDDSDVIVAALRASELPVEVILAGIQDASVKAELISNTERSVARGVFGAPSFFVGEELFFGKDKLRDVEDEIVRKKGGSR